MKGSGSVPGATGKTVGGSGLVRKSQGNGWHLKYIDASQQMSVGGKLCTKHRASFLVACKDGRDKNTISVTRR